MNKNLLVYSIIIPLYNEEEAIIPALKQIKGYFNKRKIAYEVILVNDGSTDTTVSKIHDKIISNSEIKLLGNVCNEGKGAAVRKGILNSCGDYLIFMDADMSVPIEEMDSVLDLISNKDEVIIGIRDEKAKNKKVSRSFARKLVNRAYNFLANFLFNLGIKDVGCGFKCFPSVIAKEIFARQRIKGWVFDVELLLKARQRGIYIKELPVSWTSHLVTHINIIPDSIYCVFDLLRIFYYNLFHKL